MRAAADPADPLEAPDTPWTRDDWVALLGRLTDGFVRAIPPGGSPAATRLPGARAGDQVPAIEGFARMSVAWAAWLREPSNPAIVRHGGRRHDIAELVATGLADATNPASAAWWGGIVDRDQRIVEAAEIATAIWLGGGRLRAAVTRVDPAAFDRVLDWLALVDGKDVWDDNWVLFPLMARIVRRAAGRRIADGPIDAALDWMSAHHVGDGWYSDGAGHALDLYSGWAIHWHFLWWAAIDGDRRPRLRSTIVRRARAWLRGVAPAVAADGAFPLFGRSLGYRFAIAAPFVQAALLGHDPLPAGLARRLASAIAQRAVAADAIDPATNWLRVGVGGERPAVVEGYVSPGAVAWAAHALVGLALPETHPFWSAPEAPLPADRGRSGSIAAASAGLLVSWSGRTGETRLHNARSGHPADIPGHDYAATYGKLTYRSAFPFDVPVTPDAGPGADDAIVAFDAGHGAGARAEVARHRNETETGTAGPGWIVARYRLPTAPRMTRVTTIVLLVDDADIRLSLIRPAVGNPIRIREGSAAIAIGPGDGDPGLHATEQIVLRSAGRTVAIRTLAGYDRMGIAEPSTDRANLIHERSRHAYAEEREASSTVRLVAAVSLAIAGTVEAEAVLRGVRLTLVGPDRATIDAPGMVAAVALGRRPPSSVEIGGFTARGPGLRVVRASPDGSSIAGERIERIDGVLVLDRPGPVSASKLDGAIELTTASGVRVDPGWSGPALDRLVLLHGPFGEAPVGRLDEPGVVPHAVVRQLARRAGTRLVTLRLERR